ncbi:MAG: tautomerase family protein [Alphaproteobacteria bacterium]|nr:tautomerase family protein [Alphaproteobacteria bacterium]
MPLVRISLRKGRSIAERRAIADGIHRAMVATIDVPAADRFQVTTEHDENALVFDANYLSIARSEGFVMIQITLRRGRTPDKKRALYRAIVENLAAAPGVRPQDIFVSLVENEPVDWSFGDGVAQYSPG